MLIRFLCCCSYLFITSSIFGQGFSSAEALKRMELPAGFSAKLVAAEPLIRQPLSISFDERGRLWVLQYLQYPNPAGLTALKRDEYLRTVWDKVPEPPPAGPKGVDRITILSDPDASGQFTKSKDFLSDLNLCSGFCLGHGGVYVIQAPYLLFYADSKGEDKPDGPPTVLLKGFGMEDTHSLANNLQWGPDGWLYGAAGSTSTSRIHNPAGKAEDAPIEFQQGIWRYHPKSKRFELFSEGGGNIWGLDFDKHGQILCGTNNGGKAMMHAVQGANYIKMFTKHGALHNPFTYGYFDHVPYRGFQGGHVTNGGRVYQAERYPPEYRDQYIAGNLLSNAVNWHAMTPAGNSFTATHGGTLLKANDTWFRPVDCQQGPDGCLYVADWYDRRASHTDPIDNWDKTNGRIYKIDYPGAEPAPFDLTKLASTELVELLHNSNKWYRIEAKRLLAERKDKSVLPALQDRAEKGDGWQALEAFWAAYQLGGFEEQAFVEHCLNSSNEQIRAWTIRLLGDDPGIDVTHFEHIISRVVKESSPIVRAQMASTAKRLRNAEGLRLVRSLLRHSQPSDATGMFPLLCWWALESHADDVESLFQFIVGDERAAGSALFESTLLERLIRRFAAREKGSEALIRLLQFPHSGKQQAALMRGLYEATTGATKLPLEWKQQVLAELQKSEWNSVKYSKEVLSRLGDEKALAWLFSQLENPGVSTSARVQALNELARQNAPGIWKIAADQYRTGKTVDVRQATLAVLQQCPDNAILLELVAGYPASEAKLKPALQTLLLSRPATAAALLKLVDGQKIPAAELPITALRVCTSFQNAEIDAIILKHWGSIGPVSSGEKAARIRSLGSALRKSKGDANHGKEIFAKSCAACHQIFGEGGKVGPDLTSADRKNLDTMLTQIVDPSATIRPEYISHTIRTVNGQTLSGLVKEATAEKITLLNVRDNLPFDTVVLRSEVEEFKPSPISLMPEKLLDTYSEQETADLFAYMQTDPPKKEAAKKLKIVLISGSLEYKSDESLVEFQKYLEANHAIECKRAFRKTDDDIPGLDALKDCDLAIFFTRRLTVDGEQLKLIKDYLKSGKPVIGIRTASHGFQKYLEMDSEIFGGDYKNHFKAGPPCTVKIEEANKAHPILKGVEGFTSPSSLYKNADTAKDITILLRATNPMSTEPVAWTREANNRKVFYTSLGSPDDFKIPAFRTILVNAIQWATR